jgi:hypothetical protein
MKLADLPVIKVKRILTDEQADELVGTYVSEKEPNITEAGIYVDADTNEPFLAYFPMEEEVAMLRAAVLNIKYSETVRQSTGMRNESRTFGMAPRKAYQRRESCRPTALAVDQPDEHSVLVAFADKFDKMFKEFAPDIHSHDHNTINNSGIAEEWRMTDDALWTSGVVNKSSTLPFHRDGFNFATWSAMPVIRRQMRGGYLNFAEYDATVSCRDGWVLFFPGYKYVHAVTPMKPVAKDAYRYSVVYYALRGMKDCFTYAVETATARVRRTEREEGLVAALKGEKDFTVKSR